MDGTRVLAAQASSSCCCRQYVLLPLGSGSSATVYEVFESDGVSREFAVKVFKDPEACKKEYEILKDLRHDNIVQCLGKLGFVGNKAFIPLERMVKGSLENIYKHRKLEDIEVKFFVLQLLNAVGYLHRLNIVHRDIKGPNCLIGDEGRLKLADFGRAVKEGDKLLPANSTPPDQWTAPELFQRVRYDGKPADVWRVACTWLEMVNRDDGVFIGRPGPFSYGETPPIPATFTQEAAELIGRMLNQDPRRRPTVDDLLNDKYFESAEEEYLKYVREGKSKGVQDVNGEGSNSVEDVTKEFHCTQNPGVLVFSSVQPPYFLEKMRTFSDVFEIQTRLRHNECMKLCMAYAVDINSDLARLPLEEE